MDIIIAPMPLLRLAMRLLGLGFVVDAFPFLEAALKAAVLLFGAPGTAISTLIMQLVNMFGEKALMAAASSLTMLVLGSPVVIGSVAGFAVKVLVFAVRGTAGLVYLTVDLTARGVLMAGKAAWNALPSSSPPPAYWHIEDNYRPTNRESRHPPLGLSHKNEPPIILDEKEVAKLAGGADVSASLVPCTDDDIAVILGRSVAAPSSSLPSMSRSPSDIVQPIAREAAATSSKPASAPSSPAPVHADSPSQLYPVATVSQDAFAGFLSQSMRKIQQHQETHPNDANTEEEVEEMIRADPAWAAPPSAAPGYAARKLEQSADIHASRLRLRDPIVDSWIDVSAPMMDE